MTGLVLSGGGLKGSYQIGVYKALKELNYEFDIITGSSIGAINGAIIASNEYKKAIKLWENVKLDFVFTEKVNEDLIVLEYLKNIVAHKGMDVSALQKNIEKYLNKDKFFNSNVKYGLVTVNKKTKKAKYMTKEELTESNIVDYLMASSCFYPVFQSKKIENEEYLDGGFRDYMPIDFAIKLGADEIIAVDLEAIGVRKKIDGNANIKYIKPNNYIGVEMIVDNKQVRKNLKYGYNDTMKYFNKLDGKKYTFKKNELDKYLKKYKKKFEVKANIKKKDYKLTKNELRKIIENLCSILKIDDTKIYSIRILNKIIKQEVHKQNQFKKEINKIDQKSLTFKITDKIAIYLSII